MDKLLHQVPFSDIRKRLKTVSVACHRFQNISMKRHFIKGIPKEVETNPSRFSCRWEKNVNDAIDATQIRTAGYIPEELATIAAPLSRMQEQTDDMKQLIDQIDKLSDNLSKLKNYFRRKEEKIKRHNSRVYCFARLK